MRIRAAGFRHLRNHDLGKRLPGYRAVVRAFRDAVELAALRRHARDHESVRNLEPKLTNASRALGPPALIFEALVKRLLSVVAAEAPRMYFAPLIGAVRGIPLQYRAMGASCERDEPIRKGFTGTIR